MEWRWVISISAFLLLIPVGVIEGLKCYQCGTFLATTSVSPCKNLTRLHLQECHHPFCSKYVGLGGSTVVYGCESNCQERLHGSFNGYCCTEDRCNAASLPLHKKFLSVLLLFLVLGTWIHG